MKRPEVRLTIEQLTKTYGLTGATVKVKLKAGIKPALLVHRNTDMFFFIIFHFTHIKCTVMNFRRKIMKGGKENNGYPAVYN